MHHKFRIRAEIFFAPHGVAETHLPRLYLTTGSCVSVRIWSYEARGKFGEHEKSLKVSRGVAESNYNFCSSGNDSSSLRFGNITREGVSRT